MSGTYGGRGPADDASDDLFAAVRATAKRLERLSSAATASDAIRNAALPPVSRLTGIGASATRLVGVSPNLQLGVLPAIQNLPGVQAFRPPAVASMLPSLKGMFSLPVSLWREPIADVAHQVAHASAPDRIADLMQWLAETRVQPRLAGLRRKTLAAWDRLLELAREQSRRAVAALTGQRTRIDSRFIRPSLQHVPPSHHRRSRAVVLPYAQVRYDINELLIRAPQLVGPSGRAEVRLSGETWWMTRTPTSGRQSTMPSRETRQAPAVLVMA